MIKYEALFGNQNEIYPAAGLNILTGTSVTAAGTVLTSNQWLILADTTLAAFSVLLPVLPLLGKPIKL